MCLRLNFYTPLQKYFGLYRDKIVIEEQNGEGQQTTGRLETYLR